MQKFAESGGEGLSVKYSYDRIRILWHQRSICFMVLGGRMDAPACGKKKFRPPDPVADLGIFKGGGGNTK
jgi:hypothetical protein